MKVAELKEDRLIAYHIEQLNKLNYFDTDGKTLYQLRNTLATIRFNRINHDSSDSVWFE